MLLRYWEMLNSVDIKGRHNTKILNIFKRDGGSISEGPIFKKWKLLQQIGTFKRDILLFAGISIIHTQQSD